jgi:hypothetical protein
VRNGDGTWTGLLEWNREERIDEKADYAGEQASEVIMRCGLSIGLHVPLRET